LMMSVTAGVAIGQLDNVPSGRYIRCFRDHTPK